MPYKVRYKVRQTVAHPVPTKVFLRPSPGMAMLFAPDHLHLSHPFCLHTTSFQRILPEVISQAESFILEIPTYIRKSVKLIFNVFS